MLNGIPDIFFGGYDVSADGQQIVYSDETGLKLLHLPDGNETLLAESVPLEEQVDQGFLPSFSQICRRWAKGYYHNDSV
ncbi:MAG: hypothetical protein ACOX2X_02105 [Peptococcia bacterium]